MPGKIWWRGMWGLPWLPAFLHCWVRFQLILGQIETLFKWKCFSLLFRTKTCTEKLFCFSNTAWSFRLQDSKWESYHELFGGPSPTWSRMVRETKEWIRSAQWDHWSPRNSGNSMAWHVIKSNELPKVDSKDEDWSRCIHFIFGKRPQFSLLFFMNLYGLHIDNIMKVQ